MNTYNNKKHHLLTIILTTVLAITILWSNMVAYAAVDYPAISSTYPFKAYTISSGNTRTYSDSKLTKPTGWIYGSDEIWISAVGSNAYGQYVAKGSYPTSSGRKTAWFLYSAITVANPYPSEKGTATTGMVTYRRPGGAKAGSISKGDTVYKLGTKDSYTNVLYNIGSVSNPSGWRYAWIPSSNYNYYINTGNNNTKTYTGYVNTSSISLVLRKTASSSGTKLTTMPKGSTVTVLDNKAQTNGFYHVTYSGITGYASAQYITFTKPPVETNVLVSSAEISSAASKYGISTNSNAYKALLSINTKYYGNLYSDKKGTNVFFFEGVGNNSSVNRRLNAMCVVVKNGKIAYINRNSSTIPDDPFNPSKNGGTAMPTLRSGIYKFTTKNHSGKYAALNVTDAKVIRHSSKTKYTYGTSNQINIHRRSSDSINNSWVNSAGCLIVGATPKSHTKDNEYAKFIQAVGIVGAQCTSNSKYQTSVSGKVVIDRTYANNYMRNIGYSANAISAIG